MPSLKNRKKHMMRVTDLLRRMGVPAHLNGYYYLRSAIIISLGDSSAVSSVTKLLYPEIAKEFVTTEQKVERGIRNAIEVAWKTGNPDFFVAQFGYRDRAGRKRPSNSECIAGIVDFIRMEDMQEEEKWA